MGVELTTLRSRVTCSGHLGGSVKHLTLDFGSGHDFKVVRLSPVLDPVLDVEPA